MENRIAHELNAKWRSDDVKTNELKNFDSFNLDARILAGLTKAGYKVPSPVQLEAIPLCQTGKNTFVQGIVGTGKTLVFSILALTTVLKAEDLDDLQVLIVALTREGACQIYETIEAIGGLMEELRLQRFIGGLDLAVDKSNAQHCNVAVGTPGRLCKLIDEEVLQVNTIRLFVIDDVDELLNKFMRPEVSHILDTLPSSVQTVVTSLTCTDDVVLLANEYIKISALACICNKQLPPLLGMTHYHHIVPFDYLPVLAYRKKLAVLKDVLLKVKYSQCIIFCNPVYRVELLVADIKICGLPVSSLSKAMDQVDRLRALRHLRKNKCKVLITTDVGSRGLDAKNVDLVVNFDIPYDSRTYLQRCGRAGRYGTKCSSITFLSESQKNILAEFENDIQFKSFALPEPIPEVLNNDINSSEASGLPCEQPSSECDIPVYIITNLVELNANVVSNQAKERERAAEIKAIQYFNEIYAGNREYGPVGIGFSASETVPKSKLKTSKDLSHEEFHGVQMKREQIRHNKFARISLGTKEKKTSVNRNGRKLVNRNGSCCCAKPCHSSQLYPFPNYDYPNHFQMHRDLFYYP